MWSDVRIESSLWEHAGPVRRAEWRALIADVIRYSDIALASETHDEADNPVLLITPADQGLNLSWANDAFFLPHDVLSDHIAEYVDIVRQLARSDRTAGSAHVEALDMAKKVVHDKAGRALRRAFTSTPLTLEFARKLYSLILSVRIDTTRLVGIHGHRRLR